MNEAAVLRVDSAAPAPATVGLRALGGDGGATPPAASQSPAALPDIAPRLEIAGYDLGAALALERELGISHTVSQLLVRRGLLDAVSASAFLEARDCHAPECFAGIADSVDLIQRHIAGGHRIVVHGDYDVDGVCATAIMIRALRTLGAQVSWFLPGRIDDGYGLSLATVQRLGERGTELLITVDCGITAVDEVAAARAAGIDVVLSDHHSPRSDGQLPDCPIVHPVVCSYPCPDLCGTAVAFKLAQALRARGIEEELELVALATVADLVPLRGENRRLVRDGLKAMANTARPGLRALMTVSRADPSALDTQTLGYRLAPRINAGGRLRRADAGLELLLTEDAGRAAEIAAELDAVNAERRAVEQRMAWEAEAQVSRHGDRAAFVLASAQWHPGVIGIVASRIVERYHRPTVLVSLDGDGTAQGSGRSVPGFDLLGALHATAEHLERYGGHRAAAGLTLSADRLPAFRAAFERYADQLLTPDLRQPVQRVDAIVSGSDLGLPLAEELAQLEPCGIGNPRGRLLVPGARFSDVRPMGEGRHARFSVRSAGARARAVAFGCEGRFAGQGGEPVDATFKLELGVWNGAVEPRLVLCHAAPCAGAGIEVLGEPEAYLDAVLEELERPADFPAPEPLDGHRELLDRRGQSPLAVLTDAAVATGTVLAVCADVPRRLDGLRQRIGGFSLVGYGALELEPSLVAGFAHIVALDPPTVPAQAALLRSGSGFTHLAWGNAELRFAEQMHELEYGLRTSLVALYRSLRLRGRVVGEELERLLRGDRPHARPARLAGRLVRVLAELELVSLDRDLPALTIAGGAQTALERSPAFRVYAQRHEDGRRYLSSANLRPSG